MGLKGGFLLYDTKFFGTAALTYAVFNIYVRRRSSVLMDLSPVSSPEYWLQFSDLTILTCFASYGLCA